MKVPDLSFGWRLIVFPLLTSAMLAIIVFTMLYWLATDRPIKVRITDKEVYDA